MSDLDNTKSALRSHFRVIRAGLEPADKRRWDAQILGHLLALPQYTQSERLLCYVSMAQEVDTYTLIHRAWEDGKRVAVPRCVPGERRMEFYEIAALAGLTLTDFGVLEPDPSRATMVESFEDALCIVPGLAFDSHGYRLGYGGGYYDRFLAVFSGLSVGLCYSACCFDPLPRGEHDRSCDVLVTEQGVVRTADKEKAPA